MKLKTIQFRKKTLTLSLIIIMLFSVNILFSQKVQVDFGVELGLSKYQFLWTGDVESAYDSDRFLQTPIFINVTGKIKGNFYLKAGFLHRRFKEVINFDWISKDGKAKFKILPLNIEQYTFYLLPEYRYTISEKLKTYFNIGFSYSTNSYIDELISSHPLYIHEYYRDKRLGYALNIGIEKEIIKNFGFSLSFGLSGDKAPLTSSESPVIAISRYYFTYGVMYMFK